MPWIQLELNRDVDVAVRQYMIKTKEDNKKVAATKLFEVLVSKADAKTWTP